MRKQEMPLCIPPAERLCCRLPVYSMCFSGDSFYYLHNDRYHDAEDDHCSYREVKAETFFFNSNVTRQAPYPVQFV
jgi:hypothetical protein